MQVFQFDCLHHMKNVDYYSSVCVWSVYTHWNVCLLVSRLNSATKWKAKTPTRNKSRVLFSWRWKLLLPFLSVDIILHFRQSPMMPSMSQCLLWSFTALISTLPPESSWAWSISRFETAISRLKTCGPPWEHKGLVRLFVMKAMLSRAVIGWDVSLKCIMVIFEVDCLYLELIYFDGASDKMLVEESLVELQIQVSRSLNIYMLNSCAHMILVLLFVL